MGGRDRPISVSQKETSKKLNIVNTGSVSNAVFVCMSTRLCVCVCVCVCVCCVVAPVHCGCRCDLTGPCPPPPHLSVFTPSAKITNQSHCTCFCCCLVWFLITAVGYWTHVLMLVCQTRYRVRPSHNAGCCRCCLLSTGARDCRAQLGRLR